MILFGILDETGIQMYQLCSNIEMTRNWKLVSSRIDKSSYPNRNSIGIAERGRKVTESLRNFMKIPEI
ncbi:MAG: hypothetical protein QXU18_12690 [Thermoplasmatales archaeon]